MKSVIGWIVLALVVLWVINNPDSAADMVQRTGDAVDTLIHLN